MCFAEEPGWRVETVGGDVVVYQWIETVGNYVTPPRWIERARIPAPIAVLLRRQILDEHRKRPRADPNYMYGQIDGFTVGGA